jgi:hypothetical protein
MLAVTHCDRSSSSAWGRRKLTQFQKVVVETILTGRAFDSTKLAAQRRQNFTAIQPGPRLSNGPRAWRESVNNGDHRSAPEFPVELQDSTPNLDGYAACSASLLNIQAIGEIQVSTPKV